MWRLSGSLLRGPALPADGWPASLIDADDIGPGPGQSIAGQSDSA
jgi:hypothetical protein